MTRRNGKPIHANRLVPSLEDDVMLADAVEMRFLQLCETHQRKRGERLVPPKSLHQDFFRWRAMRVRHKSGDLRHTAAEMLSTRAVADWTLEVHAMLHGLPVRKVDWK